MPYIDQTSRDALEGPLNALIAVLGGDIIEDAGRLNYVITRLVTSYPLGRYKHHAMAAGILDNAKSELYRRVTTPYEDQAIDKNGDVY